MEERGAQWPCPYCSLIFPTRKDIQLHLQPDNQRLVKLLAELGNLLRTPRCRSTITTKNHEISGTDGSNDNKLFLRCPNPSCAQKHSFSKRTHMIRHYKSHVLCNIQCNCGNTFTRADVLDKHLSRCSESTVGLKRHLSNIITDCLRREEERRALTDNSQEKNKKRKNTLFSPETQLEPPSRRSRLATYEAQNPTATTFLLANASSEKAARDQKLCHEGQSGVIEERFGQDHSQEDPISAQVHDLSQPVGTAYLQPQSSIPSYPHWPYTSQVCQARSNQEATADWDLLFVTDSTLGLDGYHANVTDCSRTTVSAEEFPFSVLASDELDGLWSDFHAGAM